MKLAKCNLMQRGGNAWRFLTTGRGFVVANSAASKLKYEASSGAHCRAPHDKSACEDAYFIWNENGIAAFGILTFVVDMNTAY